MTHDLEIFFTILVKKRRYLCTSFDDDLIVLYFEDEIWVTVPCISL